LQTALANLVEANVIKTKASEVKGGAIEYALVDETRLENREVGGPKLDMGGGSNLDEGGPVLDMGGPKLDMPGPNSDMGGPNLDNNTTLMENPLVDDPLKDPSYVEAGLPDPVSHSPKSDKLKGVKDFHPFARIVASGTHTQKPMSSKGTGSSKSLQLPESAKSQKSQKSQVSSDASSVSSGEGSVATSAATPPMSQPPSAAPPPGSKKATRVKLSKSLEAKFFKYSEALRTMKPVTAQSAVTLAFDWIIMFFRDTKPEELAEFLKIRDQETLYDKLAEFFAPHLAKHLERFTNTPERKLGCVEQGVGQNGTVQRRAPNGQCVTGCHSSR
jgi:hypothetical protein